MVAIVAGRPAEMKKGYIYLSLTTMDSKPAIQACYLQEGIPTKSIISDSLLAFKEQKHLENEIREKGNTSQRLELSSKVTSVILEACPKKQQEEKVKFVDPPEILQYNHLSRVLTNLSSMTSSDTPLNENVDKKHEENDSKEKDSNKKPPLLKDKLADLQWDLNQALLELKKAYGLLSTIESNKNKFKGELHSHTGEPVEYIKMRRATFKTIADWKSKIEEINTQMKGILRDNKDAFKLNLSAANDSKLSSTNTLEKPEKKENLVERIMHFGRR
ncbi:MAG: hypothetical protein JO131_08235 [Gammaproteobacteria bacterium]|nr:hypothetical protein [Gammaproteobacteria bacterium]